MYITKNILQENNIRGRVISTDNSNSNPDVSSVKIETIQNENPDTVENCQNKKCSSTQTEQHSNSTSNESNAKITTDNRTIKEETVWNINNNKEGKSIADQVKEVAQSALQQSGMVYVESAGMYYDYKTGYYYNSVSVLNTLYIEYHK